MIQLDWLFYSLSYQQKKDRNSEYLNILEKFFLVKKSQRTGFHERLVWFLK